MDVSFRFFTKREWKILVTFLIIFAYFSHWVAWNENSRLDLVGAIVEEGRLEIDSYYHNTGDRVLYNGHYYSDKEPGPSFLAVPSYFVWQSIYNLFPEDFRENDISKGEVETTIASGVKTVDYLQPSFFISIAQTLVTISTSVLFGSLSVVLVYKISKFFTNKKGHRLLVALVYGFGTLAFHYSMVFQHHIISTFFALLAFYLLLKIKHEKDKKKMGFLVAGLSIGFALISDASMIVIAVALFAYLLSYHKNGLRVFLLGGLIGVLPLLVYNYILFDNPFWLARFQIDPTVWPHLQATKGINTPNPFIALHLLVFPYKGLLFYFPVLFLSLVGLFYMSKRFKAEALFVLSIFLSFLILNSSWWEWWGGVSFGPRHLVPVIPFLMLPLLFVFKNFDHNFFCNKKVVGFLIVISVYVNLIGLQLWVDPVISPNMVTPLPEFENKFNSFEVLANPLNDYYLPLFLQNGPRSYLLEGLFFESGVNIRDRPPSENHLPFLSSPPLIFLVFLIWHKEILTGMQKGVK